MLQSASGFDQAEGPSGEQAKAICGKGDFMQNDLKIHCEDPKLKLIWESVVEQINLHDTVILGVPCDLLSELSSCTPDKAACFAMVCA